MSNSNGQWLKLATIGNKGRSTGPHLDWRISKDGKIIDPETIRTIGSKFGIKDKDGNIQRIWNQNGNDFTFNNDAFVITAPYGQSRERGPHKGIDLVPKFGDVQGRELYVLNDGIESIDSFEDPGGFGLASAVKFKGGYEAIAGHVDETFKPTIGQASIGPTNGPATVPNGTEHIIPSTVASGAEGPTNIFISLPGGAKKEEDKGQAYLASMLKQLMTPGDTGVQSTIDGILNGPSPYA
jgi:hypothetical protein